MTYFEIFGLLVFCHALADYPLQTTWIATTKSHRAQHPSGYPWYQSLAAHSVIHGGFVGIVTGHVWLGILEAVSHWIIDFLKSENTFGVNVDQLAHIGCKILWVGVLMVTAQ